MNFTTSRFLHLLIVFVHVNHTLCLFRKPPEDYEQNSNQGFWSLAASCLPPFLFPSTYSDTNLPVSVLHSPPELGTSSTSPLIIPERLVEPISLLPGGMMFSEVSSDLIAIVSAANPMELYKDLRLLGKGSSGKVYKATQIASGQLVAIKRVTIYKEDLGLVVNEIRVLKNSRHDNIVNFVDVFLSSGDVWLVMEYMDGGDLNALVYPPKLTENQIAAIAREILNALVYIHSQNVIHRDIKSANVLLSNRGEVKLADFGLSVQVKPDTKYNTMCGTHFYMAPEMVANKPYGTEIDIWSFGILLFEMVEGKVPYSSKKDFEVIHLIAENGAPKLESPEKVSSELMSFIDKCLQVDPEQRPKASELLEDPFLKSAVTLSSLSSIINKGNAA